ncbi:TonB-dependent receptor domain-containing protein [Siphonobacter curvatus]|nr:TonB-dependent receptor [Siphonobacter curvatus]
MNLFFKRAMIKYLFFLFAMLSLGTAFAQFPAAPGGQPKAIPGTDMDTSPKGNSKVSGFVVDSALTKAVEFASVALYSKATNKPVDGTVADDKGKFTLNRVAEGNYKLLITFIGYTAKTVDNVVVKKGEDLDLGVIKLSASTRTLQEVTVTGQRELIEEKVDRMVYNAEKDITAKGGDAGDILRKVPMLSVDLDGNVQLRGSSNVRVLINGKPSTIVAQSVADALKLIPSEMIKSVEVITSPSAKYDAEGSGGIINIITKKNTLQGLTLNIDSGVGNRGANLGLNGNYRRGKLGFSLNGFGRASYNVKNKNVNDQTSIVEGVQTLTNQTSTGMNQNLFGRYSLGMDYDISKTASLNGNISFGTRNGNNTQDLVTGRYRGGVMTGSDARHIDTKDFSNTVDANIDYTKTFKPQQELSISGQFSRNNRTNNYLAELMDGEGTIGSRQKNDNESYNQETTIQVDYQTPIGKTQLVEFGGKSIFRQVQSDYKYFVAPGENGAFITDTTRTNNQLNYDQNVMAGYATYQLSTKNKWYFKAGARYERTFINADFKVGFSSLDIPDYNNLVPSINISKSIGAGTLKWGYNLRLQRPGIQSLNPNVNIANPVNVSLGNPYLRPELTDNVEMSYSTSINKTYLNFTGFYRHTGNSIEQVRSNVRDIKQVFEGTAYGTVLNSVLEGVAADAIVTTSSNIGKQEVVGVNVFGNVSITPKISVGGGTDIMYSMLSNGSNTTLRASNSGFNVSGRFNLSISLKNSWAVQGFGFIRGRQIQLQGTQGGMAFYNLGVRKEFKDKKASLGLGLENFLNFNGFKVRNSFDSPAFSQRSVNTLYNTGVRVTFSYRIGKMSFDQPQRRRGKGVNNDDIKSGGEGDGGGQPQNQQPQNGTPGGNRPGGGRPGGQRN